MYGNIALPDWLRDRSRLAHHFAAAAARSPGRASFVLYDPPPPFELTYEDRDLLKTVGRHVATQLAQHEADRRLAESRQFEAYNRLTAFMMHDLKNSVGAAAAGRRQRERHKHNPEFIDDAIGTIANTVERMTRLIEQLRGSTAPDAAGAR